MQTVVSIQLISLASREIMSMFNYGKTILVSIQLISLASREAQIFKKPTGEIKFPFN